MTSTAKQHNFPQGNMALLLPTKIQKNHCWNDLLGKRHTWYLNSSRTQTIEKKWLALCSFFCVTAFHCCIFIFYPLFNQWNPINEILFCGLLTGLYTLLDSYMEKHFYSIYSRGDCKALSYLDTSGWPRWEIRRDAVLWMTVWSEPSAIFSSYLLSCLLFSNAGCNFCWKEKRTF